MKKAKQKVNTDYFSIPWEFIQNYKYITLTADLMFLNGLCCIVMMSKGMNLITVEFSPKWRVQQLANN